MKHFKSRLQNRGVYPIYAWAQLAPSLENLGGGDFIYNVVVTVFGRRPLGPILSQILGRIDAPAFGYSFSDFN